MYHLPRFQRLYNPADYNLQPVVADDEKIIFYTKIRHILDSSNLTCMEVVDMGIALGIDSKTMQAVRCKYRYYEGCPIHFYYNVVTSKNNLEQNVWYVEAIDGRPKVRIMRDESTATTAVAAEDDQDEQEAIESDGDEEEDEDEEGEGNEVLGSHCVANLHLYEQVILLARTRGTKGVSQSDLRRNIGVLKKPAARILPALSKGHGLECRKVQVSRSTTFKLFDPAALPPHLQQQQSQSPRQQVPSSSSASSSVADEMDHSLNGDAGGDGDSVSLSPPSPGSGKGKRKKTPAKRKRADRDSIGDGEGGDDGEGVNEGDGDSVGGYGGGGGSPSSAKKVSGKVYTNLTKLTAQPQSEESIRRGAAIVSYLQSQPFRAAWVREVAIHINALKEEKSQRVDRRTIARIIARLSQSPDPNQRVNQLSVTLPRDLILQGNNVLEVFVLGDLEAEETTANVHALLDQLTAKAEKAQKGRAPPLEERQERRTYKKREQEEQEEEIEQIHAGFDDMLGAVGVPRPKRVRDRGSRRKSSLAAVQASFEEGGEGVQEGEKAEGAMGEGDSEALSVTEAPTRRRRARPKTVAVSDAESLAVAPEAVTLVDDTGAPITATDSSVPTTPKPKAKKRASRKKKAEDTLTSPPDADTATTTTAEEGQGAPSEGAVDEEDLTSVPLERYKEAVNAAKSDIARATTTAAEVRMLPTNIYRSSTSHYLNRALPFPEQVADEPVDEAWTGPQEALLLESFLADCIVKNSVRYTTAATAIS